MVLSTSQSQSPTIMAIEVYSSNALVLGSGPVESDVKLDLA